LPFQKVSIKAPKGKRCCAQGLAHMCGRVGYGDAITGTVADADEKRSSMHGWQRFGIVLSIFWFVGVLIYLVVDTNITAKAVYQSCMRSADLAFQPGGFEGDNPHRLSTAEQRCEQSFDTMRMTPAKLLRLLVGRDGEETLTIWAIMLVPIAVFWVVGAGGFAAVRWMQRGPPRSGKA
jgi:hypothetical protein